MTTEALSSEIDKVRSVIEEWNRRLKEQQTKNQQKAVKPHKTSSTENEDVVVTDPFYTNTIKSVDITSDSTSNYTWVDPDVNEDVEDHILMHEVAVITHDNEDENYIIKELEEYSCFIDESAHGNTNIFSNKESDELIEPSENFEECNSSGFIKNNYCDYDVSYSSNGYSNFDNSVAFNFENVSVEFETSFQSEKDHNCFAEVFEKSIEKVSQGEVYSENDESAEMEEKDLHDSEISLDCPISNSSIKKELSSGDEEFIKIQNEDDVKLENNLNKLTAENSAISGNYWKKKKRKCKMNKRFSEKSKTCPLCKKQFTTSRSRNEHIRTIHNVARPFICEKCGNTYKTKAAVNDHVLTHTEIRPFKCKTCTKSFKTKYSLKVNIIVPF